MSISTHDSSCRIFFKTFSLIVNQHAEFSSCYHYALKHSNSVTKDNMVGVLGFEPRTSSLSGTRSNQLSYTPGFPQKRPPFGHGPRVRSNFRPAAGRFRGCPRSPFVRAAAPYSELRVWYCLPLNNPFRQPHLFINGGADGDRTRNL